MLEITSHKQLPTTGIMEMVTARLSMIPQRHLASLGERRLHMREVRLVQRKHGSRGKHLEQMA